MQVVKSIVSSIVYKRSVNLIGTPFEISVLAADAELAQKSVQSAIVELKRIDKLLTSLSADSLTNVINHSAGIAPVKISGELYRLIDRSLMIAELTQGAFDITYGVPFSWQMVELNAANNTVFLKQKGMRIYFGGIAKGYAADRAKYILQMEGISSGVIKAEGNITTWGTQADGSQWTIGEADPTQSTMPYADFNISNMAVATSAGRNDNEAVKSLTVMGTSAELAGAMIAPVIALGITTGTELVNRLQQMACVFVDTHNQMFASKHMNALN